MSKFKKFIEGNRLPFRCEGDGTSVTFADGPGNYVFTQSQMSELITLVREECNQWIPVGERLPDDGEYVLCYFLGGDSFGLERMDCALYSEKYGFDRRRVTHWKRVTPPAK